MGKWTITGFYLCSAPQYRFHGNSRYACTHIPSVNSLIWNPPRCFSPGWASKALTATSNDTCEGILDNCDESPRQVAQMAVNLVAYISFVFLSRPSHSDGLKTHFPEKWSHVNEHDRRFSREEKKWVLREFSVFLNESSWKVWVWVWVRESEWECWVFGGGSWVIDLQDLSV